ncbi:hypothetical protein DERP_001722 [Dermatophagoides pteronyssinus]|uniref:Uncharacterized protein n=1 Tax=Dermatophagoides pteronyssinus TaxID=6956 RepID=A0ABQ8JBB2_DERPT|nr:hypothetical protein DERP_001722 [Dermatophagoides pteronyssinus]
MEKKLSNKHTHKIRLNTNMLPNSRYPLPKSQILNPKIKNEKIEENGISGDICEKNCGHTSEQELNSNNDVQITMLINIFMFMNDDDGHSIMMND